MSNASKNWTTVRLGDLLEELRNGIFVSRPGTEDTGQPILRISAVRPMTLRVDDVRYVPVSTTVPKRENFYLKDGDLLFTRYSGNANYVGACARVRRAGPNLLYPDKLIRGRVIPDLADPAYLEAMINAPQTRAAIRKLAKTTAGQVGISGSDLRSVPIPLAPYDEQLRITAAIEEQFSRLDAGVRALERARQNLRRLRDLVPLSLLAGLGVGAVGKGVAVGFNYLWASLAEVSLHVVDCDHSTPKYLQEGHPSIDTTCISPGLIHRDKLRYVDSASFKGRVRRLVPQAGDLIFAREATVGTAVIVPEDLSPCLGQRVMLFRPNQAIVDAGYLCLVVNSQIVKQQYRPLLLGTTVPHLNVRDAKALRIPVPPLEVQKAVAVKADRINTILYALEDAVRISSKRADSLRRSILASAFSGELVRQGPSEG